LISQLNTLSLNVLAGNYVGAVVELCQSRFHPTPAYTFWAQVMDLYDILVR